MTIQQTSSLITEEKWLANISTIKSMKDIADIDTDRIQNINTYFNEEKIIEYIQGVSEEDWEMLQSFRFERVEKELGFCSECSSIQPIYTPTYKFGEEERHAKISCMQCMPDSIRRQLYQHSKFDKVGEQLVLSYACYPLIEQHKIDQESITRESCFVCGELVASLDDWHLHEFYNRDIEKRLPVLADPQINKDIKVIVHSYCRETCQHGSHNVALLYRNILTTTVRRYESLSESPVFRFRINGHSLPMFKGKSICIDCFESSVDNPEDYDSCNCNEIYLRDDMFWSEARDAYLCEMCYDYCIECNECGDEFHENDGHSCEYDDGEDNPWIHSYNYKPLPTFYGEGNCYLGIELEVEVRLGNVDTAAEYVYDTIGDRGYLKYDGSLSHGFEIVSHPHSLTEMQYRFPWKILPKLIKMGARSWDTRSCGIHVHISKNAFNDEAHQIRFTKLIYDNQRQVQRIAGRASNYASFSDKGNIVRKVKNHNQSEGRYSAVNIEPSQTIEVRVFKGSLRLERVLSAVEFVHAVYVYTKNLKMVPKDKPLSWAKFVGFVSQNSQTYSNLFTIINESFEKDSIEEPEED